MSRVFVAHDTHLDRKVVVKVLSPELAAGMNSERFKREIRVVASLQQANIVPLISAGETQGTPFYTMPFVEGRSLRERLARESPLPVADAVSILRDVARALTYAHERGVVHRDIKPENRQAFVAIGDRDSAVRILREIEVSPARSFRHSTIAGISLALGDTARALTEFERAMDNREFWPSAPILSAPIVDQIRKSPRFAELLRRANLSVEIFTSPTGGRPATPR